MDHRHGCRRARVAVGRPAVEREHRQERAEADEEQQEGADLEARAEVPSLRREREHLHVEGAAARGERREVEPDDADEQKCRAEQQVDRELHARVLLRHALRRAEENDENVDRNDDDLVAQEEDEEIVGDEGARDARDQHEQEDEELLRALLHMPRGKDGGYADELRQEEQRQGNAVDAERVRDAEIRDPRHALRELHAARREVVAEVRPDGERKGKRHGSRRHDAHGCARLTAQEAQQKRRRKRRQQDDRQNGKIHQKPPPTKRAPPA